MAKKRVTPKQKEMDYFAALYDVARVINASLDPKRVLEEITQCVVRAMNVKACSLRLLASRGKTLEMGASYGLSGAYIDKGPIIVAESKVDQKALQGKTIWLENVQTDDHFQYREKAKAEGIKSVLVLPLIVEKEEIGVLRVYTEDVRAPLHFRLPPEGGAETWPFYGCNCLCFLPRLRSAAYSAFPSP